MFELNFIAKPGIQTKYTEASWSFLPKSTESEIDSAPQSSFLALEILKEFPKEGRRIAVLGDMLELGKLTEEGHRKVGQRVKELKIDYLFTIGERAKDIARGAKEVGYSEDNIFSFSFPKEAGLFLQERLKVRS